MVFRAEDRKVLGALVFALVLVAVCILVAFDKLKWGDPVGTVFTLIAAFIGGYYINRQIRSSERLDQQHRKAKFLAARAALPLSLTKVNSYAKECAQILDKIYATRSGSSLILSRVPSLPQFPDFPNEVIQEFRNIVELGPSEIGESVATLLAHIQVQRARLEDVNQWNAGLGSLLIIPANVERYIVDTVEIYERGNSLFDYARFRSDVPREMTAQRIQAALNELHIPTTHDDNLMKLAAQWKPTFDTRFSKTDK